MDNLKSSYEAVTFFFKYYKSELIKIYSLTFLYAIFETVSTGLLGLSLSTISGDIESSKAFIEFKNRINFNWLFDDVFINIYTITLLFLCMSLILGIIFTKYIAILSAKIGFKSVRKLLYLLSSYTWEYLKDLKVGDVSAKINSQAIYACNFLIRNSIYIFNKIIVLLLLIVASLLINPLLTITSLFIVSFIYLITFYIQKNKLNFYANEERSQNIKAFNFTNNTFQNVEKINATNTGDQFTNKIYKSIKERFLSGSLINYYATIPKIVIENSIFLILTLSLLIIYNLVNLTNPFIADIFLLSVITLRLLTTFQTIYGYFVQNSTYVESWEYLKKDLINSYKYEAKQIQNSSYKIEKSLNISGITYKYENSDKLLLDSLNLRFTNKGLYILKGDSGIGKTTLMRILSGILNANKIEINLDGNTIDFFNNEKWKNTLSYIPQSQSLFNMSLKENFMLLNTNGSESNIWESLETVHMRSFVEKLPNKLETIIGPDGIGISGGEEQRIILATSIFQNRRILFFDEITNELDKENKILISKILKDYGSKKLIIGISHDQEIIENSDFIIELS